MNKQMKILLCVVMAAALCLMALCIRNWQNLGNDLRSYQQQLEESRGNWESIAAEKEALQVNLKATQKEIKEKQLFIDEKAERAEKLRNEIEQLQTEIEALKQDQ